MKQGSKVIYSGYEGTITAIHAWADNQMADVRLDAGTVCVDMVDLKKVA